MRLESVQLVCAIAALLGLRLWQVDFVSAFLNSKNTFEIYMEQPPGFDEEREIKYGYSSKPCIERCKEHTTGL